MLLEQPVDVYINEGETAVFRCLHSGTTGVPWWIINGFQYSYNLLPARHTYRQQALLVRDVQLSDNASTYQCYFNHFDVVSTVGTLYYIIHHPGMFICTKH